MTQDDGHFQQETVDPVFADASHRNATEANRSRRIEANTNVICVLVKNVVMSN